MNRFMMEKWRSFRIHLKIDPIHLLNSPITMKKSKIRVFMDTVTQEFFPFQGFIRARNRVSETLDIYGSNVMTRIKIRKKGFLRYIIREKIFNKRPQRVNSKYYSRTKIIKFYLSRTSSFMDNLFSPFPFIFLYWCGTVHDRAVNCSTK